MADLTITAGNVVPAVDATIQVGIAGEAITAGQPLYLNSATQRLLKADANDTAALADVVGVAVNSASTGQPVSYCTLGNVVFGSIITQGEIYILSDTAGGIAPVADQGASEFVTIIGVGVNATTMRVRPWATGISTPSGG